MSKIYDTILGEYVKNPGSRNLSLDDLALKYMDYKMISYDEITNKKKINFSDVDLQKASIYSGEDVYITWELYKKQEELDNKLKWILENIEIPLMEVLKNMEISGVRIDRDKLKGLGISLGIEILRLEKEIHSLAGEEFNIKSPRQVGDILFGKLQIPSGKKTKTGFSVDNEVLQELSLKYEIAGKITEYRTYTKLLSTYVEALQESASIEGDLIHTNYNQTIAATGRLSSTNPNLQNIPIGVDFSGEIRQAFIPYENHDLILTFDYSQVEIRILALMSQDENLLNSFKNGEDIHLKTAKFIFGKDQITKQERKIAKAVNFGVIYGISPFGLSKMIDISMKDAKEYIDKFFQNYSKVKDFFDNVVKNCEEKLYVETIYGRKRYISGINDRNRIIKDAAKREAINMPIQGTSADIIKLAMIEIDEFIKSNNLSSKLIMQVHDELVFSVKNEEKEFLKQKVSSIMENILLNTGKVDKNDSLYINLIVDIGEGKNWGEAK